MDKKPTAKLLIIEDERPFRELLEDVLCIDYSTIAVESTEKAEIEIDQNNIGVILCDQQLPGESGLDFFARIRWSHPQIQRIIITGFTDKEFLLQAINRSHVVRYLEKPASNDDISNAVKLGFRLHQEFLDSHQVHQEHKEMAKKMTSIPYISQRLANITSHTWRFLRHLVVVISSSAMLMLILGIVVIAVLYMLKSQLGINFFEDIHFKDLFK